MKATVKQVEIKQRMTRWSLIRYQILTWCSLRNIQISNSDLDMLALLSVLGKTKLTVFCEELVKTELSTGPRVKKQKGKEKEYKFIFDSLQSARNACGKVCELGLIKKEGKNKSNIKIVLSPEIEIYTEPNLLINYKFLCLDAN